VCNTQVLNKLTDKQTPYPISSDDVENAVL